MDVGPHVELVCGAKKRDWRYERRESSDVPHREWRECDPCRPVEFVDLQRVGNQWPQQFRINAPVHEEQLAPRLMHQRLTAWSFPDRKSFEIGKRLMDHSCLSNRSVVRRVLVLLRDFGDRFSNKDYRPLTIVT